MNTQEQTKERPLEDLIELVYEFDGGSPVGYWTRGHVDKVAFIHELETEFEVTVDQDLIEYQYVRNVPQQGLDGSIMIVLEADCRRNAYTATYVDIGDCDKLGLADPCWPEEER